jgi:hypothetical protein
MMAALERHSPDHAPCAFMMFKGLKSQCADYREFIMAQLDLGLDTVVELPPRLPVLVNDHYNLHGLPSATILASEQKSGWKRMAAMAIC